MKQSPFAALTGAEKQIKWLEYQSVRLPYIAVEEPPQPTPARQAEDPPKPAPPRPIPPPEVRAFQKTRHSQYDAVIARMKQAELSARHYRQGMPL